MKYLQIFEGAELIKEINEFKKDFSASELQPHIPSDWEFFASADDSFAVVWKPAQYERDEAIEYIEKLIEKHFEWEDFVSMIIFQKVSDGGTVLDKLGEIKGISTSKDSIVDFLKSFDWKDDIRIMATNPSRGEHYLAVNILQEKWDERLKMLSAIADFIADHR